MIKNQWFKQNHTIVILSVALLLFGVYSALHDYYQQQKIRPLPQSDSQWQQTNLKQNNYYSFVEILNKNKATRVFNLSEGMFENSFKGLVLGDWYGIASKKMIYKDCKNEKEIITELKSLETQYLLVGKKQKWFNQVNNLLKNSQSAEVLLDTEEATLYYFP
jgi:hypothetical protein